jgi:signal transduction histidine kinase
MSASQPPGFQSTVLVVDDTPANLGVMAEYLQTQGFRVLIAQDGEEGLRRAELVRPDIILLDVMMPKMDGFEVCRRLKNIEGVREIPVIFMTALTESRQKIHGFEVGGVDFVTKPIEIYELRARVTTHLRLHAMQKQLAARNADLERYREGLEQQVTARTAEINERNRQLHAEVSDRERLQRSLLAATDHEQRRLAQELHDGLGQDLVGLGMLMHATMTDVKAERLPALAEIERMVLVVRNALKACHDIAHGLSPLTDTPGGLVGALNDLKLRLGGPPGPSLDLEIDPNCTIALASESCHHLYRIAQEAATNAIKHARATRVTIRLKADDRALRLEVTDDGCGITERRAERKGLGVHTMHDRAASIGGTLQLFANPGAGTTVVCEVPQFSGRRIRKREY